MWDSVWENGSQRCRFVPISCLAALAKSTASVMIAVFGTWGPEVQILSLRPACPDCWRLSEGSSDVPMFEPMSRPTHVARDAHLELSATIVSARIAETG